MPLEMAAVHAPIETLKSTVVSIVPFPIHEVKPGLIPSDFDLPASTDGEPRCLVIGESIHYVFIDETRGSLKVVNPAYVVAKSIVQDYILSQLGASIEAYPGLFQVLGEFAASDIAKKFPRELTAAHNAQMRWFEELVRLGDDDWERYRQHNAISDTQRHAAKVLDPQNTKGRPWVFVGEEVQNKAERLAIMQECPACGSEVPRKVAVCKICTAVLDQELYVKMQFARK